MRSLLPLCLALTGCLTPPQIEFDNPCDPQVEGACDAAIAFLEAEIGPGQGGVIGISRRGFGWSVNTRGMGRSVWVEGMDEPAVAIWPDEGWDRPVPI